MRVIINFFIYGFIFFLIYLFFPEAFTTLVEWAQKVYDFFNGLVESVKNKASESPKPIDGPAPKAIAYILALFS